MIDRLCMFITNTLRCGSRVSNLKSIQHSKTRHTPFKFNLNDNKQTPNIYIYIYIYIYLFINTIIFDI